MRSDIVPGARFPDFELPDHTGARHTLSALQGDDPMVVLLGRGEHCPRERQHQRAMVAFSEWCIVGFTRLVTILPNNLHDVDKLRLSTSACWPYLADEDLLVQKTLEIEEYTDTHHAATVPHALVLAPGLVIDKIYVGYWYWGRPSPYDLWADLRDLHRRIRPDFDPTLPEARAAWAATHRDDGAAPPARAGRRRIKATTSSAR
jgi:peroxiredoxin